MFTSLLSHLSFRDNLLQMFQLIIIEKKIQIILYVHHLNFIIFLSSFNKDEKKSDQGFKQGPLNLVVGISLPPLLSHNVVEY